MAWGLRMALWGGRRWLVLAIGAVIAVSGAAWAFAPATSEAGSGSVRVGPTPPLASVARTGAALPAGTRMHLTLVLKPRDPGALAAYARSVSTAGSTLYHSYLTPAEFAQRFGATRSEVQATQTSMRAHSLIAGPATANGLTIPVSGTAGQIERAFSVTLRNVATAGGRRAVVASAAPALDRGIAGDVQAVIGLTTVGAPRPLLTRSATSAVSGREAHVVAHAAAAAPSACGPAKTAATAQGAYTADQIASAYGFTDLYSKGAEGLGQTIALYELEPYDPSDVAAYQACYGTSASVRNVSVDGGNGSGSGSGEATLDIEQAIGLAPRANFLVYEAPNSGSNSPGSGPYDALNAIVTQDRAHVVSISWGDCEQAQGSNVLTAESNLLQEAATQGQSVVAATGDNGSEDCFGINGPNTQLAVDDPGSQPFVTGVGGSSMLSPGPPPTETVWNRPGPASGPLEAQGGAGGGGVSSAWDMPGYQSNAAKSLGVIGPYSSRSTCSNSSGYCRQVPDVTADADPAKGYLFYWQGSWQAVGGTSAAAPVWAALFADANSSTACRGSAIGFANPALYHAAGTDYGGSFNDITTNNNDFTRTNSGLYPAGTGYDMASGLGSPKAGALSSALCADSLRVNNPGTQVTTLGQRVSLRVTTTALPNSQLRFFASQLPPGLTISKSTGRITGRPKRIGKWLSGVAALDQNLSLRGAFFSWQVGGAPTISSVVLSGIAGGRPRLGLIISAGRGAAPLRAIWIRLSSGLRFGRAAGRVRVTGQRGKRLAFVTRVVAGRLQIKLAAPASRIRITISPGAIAASARVAGEMRGTQRPVVMLTVLTADSSGHRVTAKTRTKPRS